MAQKELITRRISPTRRPSGLIFHSSHESTETVDIIAYVLKAKELELISQVADRSADWGATNQPPVVGNKAHYGRALLCGRLAKIVRFFEKNLCEIGPEN